MRVTVFTAAVLALAAAEAAAQGNKLGVKYRVWQGSMDGHISSDEPGIPGDEVDFEDVLDVEEDKIIHDFTIWGNLPSVGFVRFNYWKTEFEGENSAPSAYTWSGVTFAAGAPVSSEIDVSHWHLMWEQILSQEKSGVGFVTTSLEVGYKNYSIVADLSDGTQSSRGAVRAPMVAVGLHFWTKLATWLFADVELFVPLVDLSGDVEIQFSEIIIDFQINPFEEFFLGFGYRRIDLDVVDERGSAANKIDVEIDGLFVSVTYQF